MAAAVQETTAQVQDVDVQEITVQEAVSVKEIRMVRETAGVDGITAAAVGEIMEIPV